MKLSEAILLGSTLKPQGIGELFSIDGKTCALGAALDAMGILEVRNNVDAIVDTWVWTRAYPGCPACGHAQWVRYWATGIIAHLNDDHRWTREAIAEWVASIEPQAEPDAQREGTPAEIPSGQALVAR